MLSVNIRRIEKLQSNTFLNINTQYNIGNTQRTDSRRFISNFLKPEVEISLFRCITAKNTS